MCVADYFFFQFKIGQIGHGLHQHGNPMETPATLLSHQGHKMFGTFLLTSNETQNIFHTDMETGRVSATPPSSIKYVYCII